MKYSNCEEDVGYWHGDKLSRLLIKSEATFSYNDLDPLDKNVEIKGWYEREFLLEETLNPQNLFLNTIIMSKSIEFIRKDPYIEKTLEQKKLIHEHYLNALETLLKQQSNENFFSSQETIMSSLNEFVKTKNVEIENMTPVLKEMLLHFKRFSCLNDDLSKILNIDLNAFIKCKYTFLK